MFHRHCQLWNWWWMVLRPIWQNLQASSSNEYWDFERNCTIATFWFMALWHPREWWHLQQTHMGHSWLPTPKRIGKIACPHDELFRVLRGKVSSPLKSMWRHQSTLLESIRPQVPVERGTADMASPRIMRVANAARLLGAISPWKIQASVCPLGEVIGTYSPPQSQRPQVPRSRWTGDTASPAPPSQTWGEAALSASGPRPLEKLKWSDLHKTQWSPHTGLVNMSQAYYSLHEHCILKTLCMVHWKRGVPPFKKQIPWSLMLMATPQIHQM